MEIQNKAYSRQSQDGPSESKIPNKELHRVVSTAIIHKNGKYLILQRSPNKKVFPGKWTVPGGGLEVGDYINLPKTTSDCWYFAVADSLRREIKEETGLEVGKLKYLLDLTFIRPDNIPVVTLSYYCHWKSGEVKLDEENVEYKWVTFEEAKNYDLIEGILEEIEMVNKILSTSAKGYGGSAEALGEGGKGENPDEVEYKNN